MIFNGFELICPFCKGELCVESEEEWRCRSCSRRFPVVSGIPDLRTFPDPYIDFEEDRAKARHLAAHAEELTFEELIRFYYLTTAVVPAHHAQQYTRGILTARSRADFTLSQWEDRSPITGSLLDVGCGTAPLLAAAASKVPEYMGVDIALRWLIVARKRLQTENLAPNLVCACAESLPFANDRFTVAAFDSSLETVRDQKQALREVYRVLKMQGRIFIITPNRFSLGPDPHINLFAGGYFPQSWIALYAKRQKAIPPQRRLLSAGTLNKLLLEAGFHSVSISNPPIAPAQQQQLPRLIGAGTNLYNKLRNRSIFRSVFRSIGPLLEAVARKPAENIS